MGSVNLVFSHKDFESRIYFPNNDEVISHVVKPGIKPLKQKFFEFRNLLYPNPYRNLYHNDGVCLITEGEQNRLIVPIWIRVYKNDVMQPFITINGKYGGATALNKEVFASVEDIVRGDRTESLEVYFKIDNLSLYQNNPIVWSPSSDSSLHSFCESVLNRMAKEIQHSFSYRPFCDFVYTFTTEKILAFYSLDEKNLEFISLKKSFINYIEEEMEYDGVMDFLEDYIVISQEVPHTAWDLWATPESFILVENLSRDILYKLKKKYFVDFLCDVYNPSVVPFYREYITIIYTSNFLPLEVEV
ncbi:MAG: hypothetical protein N3A54_01295 [Patescibacteria group bacterium]|nr:hypothetical protein [Patescibacteria group bacterium]